MTTISAVITTSAAAAVCRCEYCGWAVTAHDAGELARCSFEQRSLVAVFGAARCAR